MMCCAIIMHEEVEIFRARRRNHPSMSLGMQQLFIRRSCTLRRRVTTVYYVLHETEYVAAPTVTILATSKTLEQIDPRAGVGSSLSYEGESSEDGDEAGHMTFRNRRNSS